MHKTSKNKKRAKRNRQKNKRGTLVKRVILGFVIAGVVAFLAGAGLFFYYVSSAPKLEMSKLESPNSLRFFDNNDQQIADLGAERRTLIAANNLPKLLTEAVVSVEDRRFYNHIGVDPIRIVGSAINNLFSSSTQGGSTLTQQLIKLSFFSTSVDDQNLRRKAQEAWLAIQLERVASKDEILALYMNKVNMSNRIAGMRTASQVYFGKEPEDLTLPEAALIAGMPQAPNAFNPYTNSELAQQRRDTVLLTMLNNNKITREEYDAAIKVPVQQGLQDLKAKGSDFSVIDPFIVSALNEIETNTGIDILKDGGDVYLNIDMKAQQKLYDIVNTDQYVAFPDDQMQVASTLVDTNSGRVLAQIGGRKLGDGSMQNNLATNRLRDWGSTSKPITDYGPALEFLHWPTNHMLNDRPFTYPGTNISVSNWDLQYMGWMTMRRALMLSRNIPAVETLEAVGKENANKFLQGLGINYPSLEWANAISTNVSAESIPKGHLASEFGVSSADMAAAYAAFANGGTHYKPFYVRKIVFTDGSIKEFEPQGNKAMEETTAYMMTDMLKDVITQGTGGNTVIPGLFQAGKTGTSNYVQEQLDIIAQRTGRTSMIAPDVNFVGYTPNLSLAIWTGYKDPLDFIDLNATNISQEVYRSMMSFMTENTQNNDWVMPANIRRVGSELQLIDSNYQGQVNLWSTTTEKLTDTTTTESTEETTDTTTTGDATTDETTDTTTDTTTTEPPVVTNPPDTSTDTTTDETTSTPQEQLPPQGNNGGY
ncbi:MAG: PBP1A family penicillin-binding protein [Streptococcaceae bacterium]|nr:PBP1A family penicillin-binding protein [Streptococcaceae bacterium]